MDKDQIKSFVACLGIASLVAGASVAAPAQASSSGWAGGTKDAVSAPKAKSAVMQNGTSAKKAEKKAKKTKKKE